MAAAEVHIQVETESERIERWRAHELERAGYEAERGCPPETALRILL
jgi:hypothetical protein